MHKSISPQIRLNRFVFKTMTNIGALTYWFKRRSLTHSLALFGAEYVDEQLNSGCNYATIFILIKAVGFFSVEHYVFHSCSQLRAVLLPDIASVLHQSVQADPRRFAVCQLDNQVKFFGRLDCHKPATQRDTLRRSKDVGCGWCDVGDAGCKVLVAVNDSLMQI